MTTTSPSNLIGVHRLSHSIGPCVSRIKLSINTSTYSKGGHPVSSGEALVACGTRCRIVGSDVCALPGQVADLNHVCTAFNEHTGVYVPCQAHQLRFLPQEHVSGTYDVCALYMYLYS